MARPLKHTIDYFPHFVNAGKTLLILQNEFGNDGYAFWFKLLSLLCKTDGLVYDYNNPASWKLLLAETAANGDVAEKILQLLADIEAIDKELYLSKVIWVQHLVDNLSDVFSRRRNGSVPEKPVIANINPVIANINRQTRPDQTKPDQTRLKKMYKIVLPDYIDKELWDSFLEMRKKKHAPPTDRAIELLIKELDKLKAEGNDPNEVLKQSIMRNYTGVFPVKEGDYGAHQSKPGKIPTKYSKDKWGRDPEDPDYGRNPD